MSLAGCSAPIDGKPVIGPNAVDQAYFFAGDVPLYGQHVSGDDVAFLSYLRAMRRIDVCGLVTGDTLAKVGGIVAVGTLFALNECDVEIKVSGDIDRRYVSVAVEIPTTEPGDCDVLVPLPLSRLPGAPSVGAPAQPSVRVGLIGGGDCALTRRIANALTARLAPGLLPPRDAAAIYPARLADRDPCEVLSVLNDVVRWDVRASQPYSCRFTLAPDVDVQVSLQPRLVGADVPACSAVEFVDPPMQRRVIGKGYVDPADVVIRPAVVVDSDGPDCEVATEIATAAAKLYS